MRAVQMKSGRSKQDEPQPLIHDLQLLGPDDVANLFGVSKRLISRWRSSGDLPPYDFELRQTKRWRRETVIAWIEARSHTVES